MKGQWIGAYTGTPYGGRIVLNVDEIEVNLKSMAYICPDDERLPVPVAFFSTPNKNQEFECRTDSIQAVDSISGTVTSWDTIRQRFPEVTFPKYADMKGSWSGHVAAMEEIGRAQLQRTCTTNADISRAEHCECPYQFVPMALNRFRDDCWLHTWRQTPQAK